MRIAIIGTGFIGTTLGHALARSGHEVTFGSRHPEDSVATAERERMASIGDALFQLWIALALGQGRGRRLALTLLEV